ncbi:MAG: iron ABC transporter permease [Tannerella sp.]|jgi:iron complex transport system permease protein|nr:iron ABC transporter permease [Tannerella sp.]
MKKNPSKKQACMLIVSLFIILLLTMVVSLTIGRHPVSIPDIVRVLSANPFGAVFDFTDTHKVVIEIVRLPRILMVVLCGMGLALSGAAMQGIFRNPLVGPEIVGVSSGASFGGVLAIMLSLSPALTIVLSCCFGFAALAGAFILARASGRSGTVGLVLAGVIVGAFFSALVGIAQYVADPLSKLPSIVYWLMGSFAGATYDKLFLVALVTLVAGSILLMLRWRINLLSLGEADAKVLGVNVYWLRWGIVALVSVIVASQVSVSGGIGWVGLIVPHLARIMIGPDHVKLMPASAFLGGIFLLVVDDIARTMGNQEIPVGLLTAMIGTPVFAVLFWKTQKNGWHEE